MKILWTTIASAALALFACSPSPADDKDKKHDHQGHEAHAEHMVEGYLAVADALYKDDLAAAQKAAKGMVSHDEDSALAKSAAEITAAEVRGSR